MDTRSKIQPLDRLTSGPWNVVAGAFDPLTLEQAARIETAAQASPGVPLLAVVTPSAANHFLSPEARAALVAALRFVHTVVIAEPAELSARGIAVPADAAAEARRSTAFADLVRSRRPQ